jgi:hypothetical protein
MLRPFIPRRSFAIVLVCLLALLSGAAIFFVRLQNERAMAVGAASTSARMSGFPKLFLWAWERPEQLDFINPREVGVAFLARAIFLREEKVIQRPRMQPLKVPTGTTLIAVVRIETARDAPPSLSIAQRAETVAALIEVSKMPNISALQIDFDAKESERAFYKGLLQDLRARLPQGMPLSITALASWCIYDNWLDGLPVDEAVPMLFRMGIDERRVTGYLKEGGAFRSPLCRLSSGVSTDESIKLASPAERTYVFHTQAWSKDSVRRVIERNRNETLAP